MPNAPRRILAIALVLAVAWALQPASAADVKLTLWRLKTYIPPADKILDANAQECAKKLGAEVQIQTYTFDDMWTKYTAAIESKTLPDVAELDSVGRSEEHTSELQSLRHLVCRLLLEKKKDRRSIYRRIGLCMCRI